MTTIVSKSEFARRCNVTPSAVTQMIATNRIGPDALVGEGRRARIILELAAEHLRRERVPLERGAATMSKTEFSRRCGVSQGRISQWIGAGQIGPEALVGEGRAARILVDVAVAHLRERLDSAQRFGLNGVSTRLDAVPAPIVPSSIDEAENKIKENRIRQAVLTTRRLEEQDRLTRGVYMLARDARNENARIAAKLFETFDGAITDFAAAVAAKYGLPYAELARLLRSELRRVFDRFAFLSGDDNPTSRTDR